MPQGVDLDSLPQEIRAAVADIVDPLYQQLVLDASDPLEKSTGLTVVHLVWQEILDQQRLAQKHMDDPLLESLGNREELLIRHLQLLDAKIKASGVLVRLRQLRLLWNSPTDNPARALPPPHSPRPPADGRCTGGEAHSSRPSDGRGAGGEGDFRVPFDGRVAFPGYALPSDRAGETESRCGVLGPENTPRTGKTTHPVDQTGTWDRALKAQTCEPAPENRKPTHRATEGTEENGTRIRSQPEVSATDVRGVADPNCEESGAPLLGAGTAGEHVWPTEDSVNRFSHG